MGVLFSPEILLLIAGHLAPSAMAAFASSAKALTRAADGTRFMEINITTFAGLEILYGALHTPWRDLGKHIAELTIHLEEDGDIRNFKAPRMHEEPQPLYHNIPLAAQLCGTLNKARRLKHLHLSAYQLSAEEYTGVVRSISSRILTHLTIHHHSPLPAIPLGLLLLAESNLTSLSLPNQYQPFPPGKSEATLVAPQSIPQKSLAHLTRLRSICAPASLILDLPAECPLEYVHVSGADIPRHHHRPLFESLGGSPRRVTRLNLPLHEENLSLGVMQEITLNLRHLVVLHVRGVASQAYYTYFLQDITGCLSRCLSLQMLVFESPTYTPETQPSSTKEYSITPSSDPSIPLPTLRSGTERALHNPDLGTLPHRYPPHGPDLFRREQYYVNMYSVANPRLRSVTMPAGTRWKWSDGAESSSTHYSTQASFDVFPETSSRRVETTTSTLHTKSTNSNMTPSANLVAPNRTVPSSRPLKCRIPCYGWEPDRSCLAAREWWEASGFKPLSPGSMDETEVESDSDMGHDDEDSLTDVEVCDSIPKSSTHTSDSCTTPMVPKDAAEARTTSKGPESWKRLPPPTVIPSQRTPNRPSNFQLNTRRPSNTS